MTSEEPIEVNLTAPAPTVNEVEIGGEQFSVRVSSASSLEIVAKTAEDLYRLRPQEGSRGTAGFSLPASERRDSDVQRGSAAPYPVQPIQEAR